MRRSRHRVLRDAELRRKEAADEVHVTAGRGGDDCMQVKRAQLYKIRFEGANFLLSLIDGDVISRSKHRGRFAAQSGDQRSRRRARLRHHSREDHAQPIAAPAHHQHARPRIKPDLLLCIAQMLEQHERAGQRCVAAEVHLRRRREPAQTKAVVLGDEECGIGEVVLLGDGLHQRIRQPRGERAYSGRIAAKEALGEGVDLVHGQRHGCLYDTAM